MFSDLTDWYTLTDDKNGNEEKPQAHGSFATAEVFRSSSVIPFSAVYLGETEAEVLAAGEALTAAVAFGPVSMVYEDELRPTARTVTVRTAPVKDMRGEPTGEVELDCLAADPRRYSVGDAWQSTGPAADGAGLVWPAVWPLIWPGGGSDGRVTLTNIGSAPAAQRYRLNGGFTSALLTNTSTGQRVGFNFPVASGSVVEIDTRTRQAWIDGQSDVSRYLQFREWWDVPKYSTISVQFDVTGATGTPTLDAVAPSAWIA
ncbi:MAG TPA: hypothetical protein VNJ54_07920 [Plantibacter sp.]|uniref:hypothetical protein n=1 Tax=Plantibacter sp. TaxID=1871045 RepID=UPI002C309B24|nr:hypothetical protein [Plantibacter sp.]